MCIRDSFNIAYACLRQLSFGLLDMAWYTRNTPFEGDVKAYEQEAWKDAQILPIVPEACMSTQFSHIFAGGYEMCIRDRIGTAKVYERHYHNINFILII